MQQAVGSTTTVYVMDLNAGLSQVLNDGTNTYTYGLQRISQVGTADTEYFLGDALGSVRQLADDTGAVTLAKDYGPFGDLVSSEGSITTPYGFTAEQVDSTGIIYLRARYYNPQLGRFASRDTWDGNTKQPMSFNLWLYTYANPINVIDPSGREGSITFWLTNFKDGDGEDEHIYNYSNPERNNNFFTFEEVWFISEAVYDVAKAYSRAYSQIYVEQLTCIGNRAPQLLSFIKVQSIDPLSLFLRIHGGKVTFVKYNLDSGFLGNTSSLNSINIFKMGRLQGTGSYIQYMADPVGVFKRFIVHELGHAFNDAIGSNGAAGLNRPENIDLLNDVSVNSRDFNGFAGNQIMGWQRRGDDVRNYDYEVFADMFVGWVYDKWEVNSVGNLTDLGNKRSGFMNEQMGKWIERKLGSPISINLSPWR